MQMLNNAKAKGFWFKAFRGKRFRILKKEKKKLEKFKGLFFRWFLFFLLWRNSDMTAAAKALAAVKKKRKKRHVEISQVMLCFDWHWPVRRDTRLIGIFDKRPKYYSSKNVLWRFCWVLSKIAYFKKAQAHLTKE